MTRHLGVSVFFSVAIVVFFAVVLYQPDEPPAPSNAPVVEKPAPETAAGQVADASDSRPIPEPRAPVDEPPPVMPAVRTLPVARRSASVPPSPPHAAVAAAEPPARPKATTPRNEAPRPRAPAVAPGRRRAFIQADAGETVADVAVRVYGSPDAAGALWLANRDIVPDRDAPLRTATVLRTP